jgi:superfamily I DNA/RNA helicase
VEGGARAERGRRLHPLRHGDRHAPTNIEEERRLLYVAMTRAKEHLHLVVPNRFFIKQQAQMGDRHVYACYGRTRFIP